MANDRPIDPPKYLLSERLFDSLKKLSNPPDQDWPPGFFDAIFPPESRQIEEIDHDTHIITSYSSHPEFPVDSNDLINDRFSNLPSSSRKA